MNVYDQIASNKRKTWFLVLIFTLVVILLGWVIGEVWYGNNALVLPFAIFSIGTNIFAYYFSDKTALAISGAKKIGINQEREYFHLVENLTIATGLPMPDLYVIESPAINAFATGRDPKHSSIAVTRGALQRLEKRELEGVLAHELSHIKNFDIRIMTMVVVLVGVVALLVDSVWRFRWLRDNRDRNEGGGILSIIGILMIILAPLVANLIKFAVSRQREFLADASAAYITRYPKGLVDALSKIAHDDLTVPNPSAATAHLYFSNPLENIGSKVSNLFSTHPPVEERIRRLQQM